MTYDTVVAAAAAGAGGVGIAISVAKLAIAKAFGNLDEINKAVNGIKESLARVEVRLEKLAEHDAAIKLHSNKIAFYEGKGCKTSA